MKPRTGSLLGSLLPVVLALASCAAPPAAELADTTRLAEDVAWLADDAREGRRAGTTAALEAARYIAQRFEELGLEPAGEPDDGEPTWFQGFEVPLEPRSGGRSFLESADGTTLPRIDEKPEALLPLFCSAGGEVEGPLVFCGYGIQDEARGRDDLAGLALDGAVALVLRGAPLLSEAAATAAADNPHGAPAGHGGDDTRLVDPKAAWGGSATIFMKVMNAKRAGAAAVVLLPDPDAPGEALLPFEMQSAARAGIPCLSLAYPGRGLGAAALVAHADDPAAAAGAIELLGTRVRVRADVLRGSGPAQNVLARLPGRARRADDPPHPRRTVVVGAHYDHLGLGGTGSLAPDGERVVHNGADDNASGTAAVLEIARQLVDQREAAGRPFECDVVFALWSGEELGLLGSEHWAEHPTVPLAEVRANLNLDMVGRAGDGELNVLGAGTSDVFAGWLGAAGPDAGLVLAVSASGQGVGGSDHQTFLKREIPALHLFSGLHADYHRPTDDVERVEIDGLARVTALSVDLVRRMLAAPEIAWTVPPAKADEGREQIGSGFRVWFGSIPSYTFEGPGVLFDGISPGSPAEKAGLLPGDVLLAVGDVEIGDIYDFTYALQRYKAGDVVLTRYRRDGEEQDVRMTLASRGIQ